MAAKKPNLRSFTQTVTEHVMAMEIERESATNELTEHMLEFPGMSEIFNTEDQKRILDVQLTSLVENAVRNKIGNERRDAKQARAQAQFEAEQQKAQAKQS